MVYCGQGDRLTPDHFKGDRIPRDTGIRCTQILCSETV